MNRRLFLATLAGAVLDPERLLWRPGRKHISIPAPPKPWQGVDFGYQDWKLVAEVWARHSDGHIYRTLSSEGRTLSVERWPHKNMPFVEGPIRLLPLDHTHLCAPIPDSYFFAHTISKEEFGRRFL